MKKIHKIIATLLIFSLCFSLFYENSVKNARNLTIGVFIGSNWDVPSSDSYKMIDDIIARYKKDNPNVKVKYISGIQKEDYSEWITQQSLKGDAPDLFFVLSEDLSSFKQVGLLENLDSYIKRDDNFSTRDYYAPSFKAGMIGTSSYALPYESVPNLVFVNKTLLEKEGISMPSSDWTWDDFYRISKAITKDVDGDGKIDQFASYGYSWQEAVFSNGGELFDKEGNISYLNDEKMIESVKFIKKINELNDNSIVTAQDFDEGKVAFCLMPFSQYRAYMPYPWRVKKYSNFEWDCIALPAGPQGESVSEINTLLIGMNSRSKNKEEAWKLLKTFSYNKETQLDVFRYSQGVAVIKNVTKSEEAMQMLQKDNPGDSIFEMRLLDTVMENGKTQYQFRNYNNVISVIDTEIYRIINSQADILTNIKALQQKVDNLLKD